MASTSPITCGNISILAPDLTGASNESSSDGIAHVKATYAYDVYPPAAGPHTALEFSLDNINWFSASLEASNGYFVFSGLSPGLHSLFVRAQRTEMSAWEYCSNDFVIGSISADCTTLAFGTIYTSGESTVGLHDGSITVNASGSHPIEYRINGGAWQSSNVFGGLTNGAFTIEARYSGGFTYCSISTSRTISTSAPTVPVVCDVAITSVVVTNESAQFAEDGTITIVNTGSTPPFQYSVDEGATWQSSPAFSRLVPGNYTVTVLDANGCEDSRTVTIYKFKRAFFEWPIVNSNRIVVTAGPLKDNLPQNFDNTLRKDMRYIGSVVDDYSELFQSNDLIRLQWKSSYQNHVMEVHRKSDNSLVATMPVVKQLSFLNQAVTTVGKLANGTSGKIQLFFTDEIPDFAVVGQQITLSATGYSALNGTFTIENITNGTGAAAGYVVLILTAAWPGLAPATIDCTIDVTYDILPFDVYETVIDYGLIGDGDFFLYLTESDAQFEDTVGTSEFINVSDLVSDGVSIIYKNNDNGFNMFYETGIQNEMRVVGEVRMGEPGGNQTVMEDSDRELIKLMEYVTRNVDVTIEYIPNFLRERINLMLAHDIIFVNGVAYQKEEKPTTTPGTLDDLVTMVVKLRQVKFIAENSDDNGVPFSIDNPRIHSDVFSDLYN